jgi:hypothetical protein
MLYDKFYYEFNAQNDTVKNNNYYCTGLKKHDIESGDNGDNNVHVYHVCMVSSSMTSSSIFQDLS